MPDQVGTSTGYGKMITFSRRGNGEEENTDLMIVVKKFF